MRANYDEIARVEAVAFKDEYDKEIGKRVICRCKEEKATRLFISGLTVYADYVNKDGWWSTFTVSKKPCEHVGSYICKIEEFKVDKNGFLMCIVTPEKYIGDVIHVESKMWDYFRGYILSAKYVNRLVLGRFNIDALHARFHEQIEKYIESAEPHAKFYLEAAREVIYNNFINGVTTVEEIDSLLDTRDELEQLVYDLNTNRDRICTLKAAYPNAMEKMANHIRNLSYPTYDDHIRYIASLCWKYDNSNLGERNVPRMEKLEALAIHYKKEKELEKAAKKAARLAKKVNKTESA